jgi:putative phage-type endonuclease
MDWAEFGNALTQGTPAWLEARKKRLGGSEIAAMLGISPYKSRDDLLQEKMGLVEVQSISHLPHVKRGIDAEPIARALLEKKYGVVYTTPTLIHPEHPYFAASLDGLCDDHVIEIKTMGLKKHLEVAKGIVPDYYECQCQWNMLMAKRDLCIYASYRPEDGTLYEVEIKADDGMQEFMFLEALKFWDEVQAGVFKELDISGLFT